MTTETEVRDAVLSYTDEKDGEWCLSTSELADELGFDTSDVSRALSILLSQQLVRRAEEDGELYEPTPHATNWSEK